MARFEHFFMTILAFVMFGLSMMYDIESGKGIHWLNKTDRDLIIVIEGEDATLYSDDGEILEGSRDEIMELLEMYAPVTLDDKPFDFPFWAGIFASIIEKKEGHVAILDLNALRMNYGGDYLPLETIKKEISPEKWDLVGIGGLTTQYGRIKQLVPLIRKVSPKSTIIAGGGFCTYNPDERSDKSA